ncbi:hypothetical protein ACP6JB_008322 [Aspergillus fumigatus]
MPSSCSSHLTDLHDRGGSGSETDLMEPDHLPRKGESDFQPHIRSIQRHRPSREECVNQGTRRGLYKDPADDTDEDLSDVPEDYGQSDNTKKLRFRLVDRWGRTTWNPHLTPDSFCRTKAAEPFADLKWSDAEEALRQASPKDMHRFLNWCFKLERGKDGRRLKGYNKASALKEDWKYFRGYYTKVTKNPMSKEMGAAVRKGIRRLIDKYGLDTQVRDNTPVYIEDMVPFNETILQTREKRFHLGFQRILLCFYVMMGLFTVSRKGAMLHLQYKHLVVTLQKNPHGGPPVPMVDFRAEFIKGFLGMKELNTFSLPEIIYGVSLVFSPRVFLFAMLFHANAFEAPSLTSME